MILNNEEMLKVSGGAINIPLVGIVTSAIIFLIGYFDGLINPKKCGEK